MAEIKTLIKDIYDLMGQGFSVQSEIEKFGQRMAAQLAKRASDVDHKNALRMSNLGTECNRKLWYMMNRPDLEEPLTPDTRIKFLFGDMAEELLLFLAEEAGHSVSRRQEEVSLHGVIGHIDGFVDGHLVDCKSASTLGFAKFKKHGLERDDPFGYLVQLGGYAEALGENEASFFAIDKSLGHLCLDTYSFGNLDYRTLIETKQDVLSRKETPSRLYRLEKDRRTGEPKLATQCRYCGFKQACWPEFGG